MKHFLYLWITIVIYKIVSNTYFYFRIKVLSKKHLKWMHNNCHNFPTYKSEVIFLFKRAGIQNLYTPTLQNIGSNHVASFSADVFTNFPSTDINIFNGAIRMFYEAEGTYRHRIFESFNPLYWIDCVLFAPKNLLLYLNFVEEKTLFKICNVLLTFIWWCLCILLAFHRTDINHLLTELIGQFDKIF